MILTQRATMSALVCQLAPPPSLRRIPFSLFRRFFLLPSPPPKPFLSLRFQSLCTLSPATATAPPCCSSATNRVSAVEDVDVVPYLSCSMPNRSLNVAVLVSGGVDSSVALRLLHAAGHSCTAFYLKIWFQEDFENFWSECPWEEDLKYAKAVCDQVNVPLEVVHLSDEYSEKVVSYIIEEYRSGRTPNPDVLCNTRIKFGAFMDAIGSMDFDYVASGHYAKVVHPSPDQINKLSTLELSKDMVKDQTYFLSHLSQHQLKWLMFPLGCISKDEVRKLAKKFDLPNKDRKDSQGICFLGKIKFSEFVARHIGEMEGIILEAETGDFLGTHKGFWFYTIGQRQGLRLPGGPWYVVEKDIRNNVVFVSRNYYSVDKRRRFFRVGSLKWLCRRPPEQISKLQCKVRHGPGLYDCTLTLESLPREKDREDGSEEVGIVHLSEDDQGLAAGQFAALYKDTTCIGSGVILESWDDQGFPICEKALEVAMLEDKSKLGKPVKIMMKPETGSPKNSRRNNSNDGQDESNGSDLTSREPRKFPVVTMDDGRSESRSKIDQSISSNWWQQLSQIFLNFF